MEVTLCVSKSISRCSTQHLANELMSHEPLAKLGIPIRNTLPVSDTNQAPLSRKGQTSKLT